MRVRSLRFWQPGIKTSQRYCDWSHYPLSLWDRVTLPFRQVTWVRPFGRPEPVVRLRRWTIHFRAIPQPTPPQRGLLLPKEPTG